MGRRARVVSHGAVAAPDESQTRKDSRAANDANNNNNNKNKNNSSPCETPNAAHISSLAATCSLFTHFQQKSSDFSGEWVMLEEVEVPLTPPISHDLSQKLRHHQEEIQKQRGGGGGTGTGAGVNDATAVAVDSDNDENDGVERGPQSVDAKQRTTSQQQQTFAKNVACKDEGEEEDGIRGDYLSLLPAASAQNTVAKSDLQATLTVLYDGQEKWMSAETPSAQRSVSASKATKSAQQRVVPLWSVHRYTTEGGYSPNVVIALHQEICDFVDYLRPSEAETSMRGIIEMEIRTIAKRLWPDCEPIVFGSMSTGLMLPLSDLDMSILNVPVPTDEALTALAHEISREGLSHAAYPQLILKTKVPLVKFQHHLSLLNVDISINTEDGKRNSAIVTQMLQTFPEARPLIILIKYFLQQRGMHEPYHGGLGSFATTLLVISFLQNHPIYTERPEERSFSGLGKLLVDFFRYYGYYFNYSRCGISLVDDGYYFRRTDTSVLTPNSNNVGGPLQQRSPLGPPQVMIEDPGNTQNNAASSLRSFGVITSLFGHAYMALTADFDQHGGNREQENFSPDAKEIERRPTLLSRILHVDAPTVKQRQSIAACYDLFMQDPVNKEKLAELASVRRAEEEDRAARKDDHMSVRGGTDVRVNGSIRVQERKRVRSDSSTSSSVTSSSGTSSNSSSVRVVSRHRC